MKRSLYLVSLIAIVCSFAVPSMSVAGSRENKPLEEPKVTKKEAEHTVLFKYPGASIEKCELIKGKDHPNWVVDVVRAGAHNSTQVQVDGATGKILP